MANGMLVLFFGCTLYSLYSLLSSNVKQRSKVCNWIKVNWFHTLSVSIGFKPFFIAFVSELNSENFRKPLIILKSTVFFLVLKKLEIGQQRFRTAMTFVLVLKQVILLILCDFSYTGFINNFKVWLEHRPMCMIMCLKWKMWSSSEK